MGLVFGSVCSGIEAASVAWEPLGFTPAWLSEIEPFPKAVLAHHYPNVPNLGDMTQIYENQTFKATHIDILVGGTPCQSFSLAGARGGLDDPRGDLALEFLRIAAVKRPRWFVWENVPGVLSSSEGRDFGAFLWNVQKIGYGFAYRVLDAQYFGVPQQRRRVFVVGHLGDWRPAEAVLFDREDLFGDSATSQSGNAHQETISSSGQSLACGGVGEVGRKAATIKAGYYKCYNDNENMANLILGEKDGKTTVRRLTPLECERLMGLPDNYTRIPWKKRFASDGARYKAVGNSMVVPVMKWIGERLAAVDGQL